MKYLLIFFEKKKYTEKIRNRFEEILNFKYILCISERELGN